MINQIKEIAKNNEACIVGCFYDNLELFYDYNELKRTDFFNPVWKLYFTILEKLSKKGMKKASEADIEIFLNEKGNEKLLKKYKEFGGFSTLETLSGLFNRENIEGYIEQQKKWVAFSNMINIFNFNEETVNMISNLNVNELYDYYNAHLNNIFINVTEDVHTTSLDDGLEEIIEEADRGLKRGLNIPSPILNRKINGITQGQIMLIGGQSGSGKSTTLIQIILTAVFENEEPFVLFLNEQDHKKIKMEMLTWIINNKLKKEGEKPFNKIRWRDGKFTKEEKELIYKAVELLKEKVKNNKIIIVEFQTYKHKTVVRCIKKYASMGVKMFAIDTFKMSADADSNQPFWLVMQNQMKELDDLIKPSNLNVSLICTFQLGKGAILNRYLSANDIGMSKGILDVASVCLLIRKVHDDEYEGGKNELKVLKPFAGTSSRIETTLKRGKRHNIIFIEKNRNGEAGDEQIVVMHDLGTLTYQEIGVTQIPFGT